MICWKCHKEINIEKPVRGDECPFCHADLHVCKACEFYESGAHNDCRESSAELVGDRKEETSAIISVLVKIARSSRAMTVVSCSGLTRASLPVNPRQMPQKTRLMHYLINCHSELVSGSA